jgi:hypothetical protein
LKSSFVIYMIDVAELLPSSTAHFSCAPPVSIENRIAPPHPPIEVCNNFLASLGGTRRQFKNLDPLRLGPRPETIDDLRDEPI